MRLPPFDFQFPAAREGKPSMFTRRVLLWATVMLAFLWSFAGVARADLEWHQVMITTLPLLNLGVEGGETHTKNYLREGRLRSEQEETGLVRIVDLARRTIWIVNPSRKVYAELAIDRMLAEGRELTPLQVEGVKEAVEELRDHLEQLMKGLPEERRTEVEVRVERQLRALKYLEDLKRKPTIERTDELKMIAGFECRLYRKLFGETQVSVWVTEGGTVAQQFQSFSRMMAEAGLSSAEGVIPSGEAEGFPMLVVSDYIKYEVTYLKQSTLDDSLFQVPPDYNRVEIPALTEDLPEQ